MSNAYLRRALADLHKGRAEQAPKKKSPAAKPAEKADQSAEQSDITPEPSKES